MKKTLPAFVFVFVIFCCLSAAGQYSLNDRLIAAAKGGRTDAIQPLLDKGADLEAKNEDGQTALIVATEEGKIDTMKFLLAKGANIEAMDNHGKTALITATEYYSIYNREQVVRLLLAQGADVEAKDKDDRTALSYANYRGPAEVVDLLEEAHRKPKMPDLTQSKDPQERFAAYVRLLQQNPLNDPLREKVFVLANGFPVPPAIPEEARQLFVLATDQIKQAGTPAALDQPITLLRKAVVIAPWWGNAYFNLSRALEMRGQYDDAARQLNYYLKLNPPEADAQEVRAHLVVLQTEEEAAAHKQ
jgi:tetratricopeptide (TPR) repeat protein